MKDGLSHSGVMHILQDKKGFIWFCTYYGLSRFDGKTFKNYYASDGLSSNRIMAITETEGGDKLIGTIGGGLAIMSNDYIKPYRLNKGTIPKSILNIISDKKNIWLIGQDTIWKLFRIKNGEIHNIALTVNGHTVNFQDIAHHNNVIIIATNTGLYQADGDTIKPFLDDIIKESVIEIQIGPQGDYWAALDNKILHITPNKNVTAFNIVSHKKIANLAVDRENTAWVMLTDGGLLQIKNNKISDFSDNLSIKNVLVSDVLKDREGNMWITSLGNGIYKINSTSVISYAFNKDKLASYCKTLESIAPNKILIGTMGTVSMWNNGIIEPYKIRLIEIPYCSYYIHAIKKFDAKIYICTPYSLVIKDLAAPFKESEIKAGCISILRDKKNKIWVGGYNCLSHIEGKTLVQDTDRILLNKRYNSITQDDNGNLYLGTDNGLLHYDGEKFTSQFLGNDQQLNNINAVYKDSMNHIWVATENGLVCKKGRSIRIYTTKDGLTHNKCNAITQNGNLLWVGTLNGLNFIDLNTMEINSYPINSNSEILSLIGINKDSLLVGTINSLLLIKINVITEKTPPPLYITSAQTREHEFSFPNNISLQYNSNKLTINFTGLYYTDPDQIEYRYKIEGIDEDWRYTRNNSVELSSLPSGNYDFILSARKNSGKWSADSVLPLYITTPFWKSWWFFILALTSGIIAIYFITRWQVLKYETKKRKNLVINNKIIYLKQQALSALINPHFIFNCMNSIQHFLNRKDNNTANAYLADFANLIRMTMENAQEAFIALDKEISRIKLYLSLEKLRFGEKLNYKIVIDPFLNMSSVRIPNMILQQYIENAIWHGITPLDKGNIEIAFVKLNDSQIKITIKDDGVGLSYAKQSALKTHTSFGMKLTAERLDLLSRLSGQHNTIEIKEQVDKNNKVAGTLVQIILPLKPDEKNIDIQNTPARI
jgi:ligand-binding sensor domain-containing protein/two-component sensor histidine kinase